MPALLTDKKFSFESLAPEMDADTFAVVRYNGFESISKPYVFDIVLVSESPDIDFGTILNNPARFSVHRVDEDDLVYGGVVLAFEQMHQYNMYTFYKARLVPRLSWLKHTHNNQVFLDVTVSDLITTVVKTLGLTADEYELKLKREYPRYEYVCQYNESLFNFVSRWIEREGIYYYFEQTPDGEKIIFTDDSSLHLPLPRLNNAELLFSPPSGLDTLERSEIIKAFTCSQRQLPSRVLLKDYSYERPSLEISGSADVDPSGHGDVYIYGEHFTSPEEGKRLAGIHAEEFICRKIRFIGESTSPYLMPGFMFTLSGHYRGNYNQSYLITEVTHEGSQTGYLTAGIQGGLSEAEQKVYYSNTFSVIPSEIQFRPKHIAQKTKISGTLHASVDAESSGEYAELDSQGRYKVRMPFDLNSEHGDGKASWFVRMMQPHAGNDYGMHFPLHKGTEVQLAFINGDPDRPVITGAIPNTETISPVIDANQTKSILRDSYGNEMVFDSTPGDEHIRLHSPHHKSTFELGRSVVSQTESDAFEWKGGNTSEIGAGNKFEAYIGNGVELKAGMMAEILLGASYEFGFAAKHEALIGYSAEFHLGPKFEYHKGHAVEKSDKDVNSLAQENNIIAAGETLNLVGGAGEPKKNSSIIEATENSISLTTGNNKNPDQTPEQSQRMANLYSTPIYSFIYALIAGITMLILLELQKESQKTDSKADDILAGTMSTIFGILEGVAIFANIIIMMLLAKKGLEDDIKPVSHFDTVQDEPNALLQLHKDNGIILGINPKVSPPSYDKKSLFSKIEMDNTGKLAVNSKEAKEIVLGIGESGSETATITMKDKTIILECDKSSIRIDKDGDIIITTSKSGSGKIQIFGKGDVNIDSKSQITLASPMVKCCKGSFDANALKVYK